MNSTGNKSASGKVNHIRRYFHSQLVNLWKSVPILKEAEKRPARWVSNAQGLTPVDIEIGTSIYSPPKFSKMLRSACQPGTRSYMQPGYIGSAKGHQRTVVTSGDIDGRIKTLIDGLRIPLSGEDVKDIGENPPYCLMSSDDLITEVRVTGDFLFSPPVQIIETPQK